MNKRVVQLAQELGVPTRAVHEAMADLGYRWISSATQMTDEEIQGVRSRLAAEMVKPIEPDQINERADDS